MKNQIISTAFRDALLTESSSFKALIEVGGNLALTFYAGLIPADADDGIGSAVPLVTFTSDGAAPNGSNGLVFESALVDGSIVKSTSQTWSGEADNSGALAASFYRYYHRDDDQATSAGGSDYRIQGTAGPIASGVYDALLTDPVFADGTVITITAASIRLPRSRTQL